MEPIVSIGTGFWSIVVNSYTWHELQTKDTFKKYNTIIIIFKVAKMLGQWVSI